MADEVESTGEPLRPGEDPRHPPDAGVEGSLGEAKHPETESVEALARAEAELARLKEIYQRLAADFDNFRKRVERDRAAMRAQATEALVQRLLDVAVNFDRAIEAAGGDENAHEGITLIYRQLREILAKEGVERIDTHGHLFDPRLHEAVMREEAAQYPEGTILQEFEAGWTLAGRVVRPAKVKVAVKPAEGGA